MQSIPNHSTVALLTIRLFSRGMRIAQKGKDCRSIGGDENVRNEGNGRNVTDNEPQTSP
jgi:hypothetical protein